MGFWQAFEDKPLVDRAEHITEARLTMYNLDSVGQELAERHYGMFFRMPREDSQSISRSCRCSRTATQRNVRT